MLNAPDFWYQQKKPLDKILKQALSPLGAAYGWLVRKRFDLYFPVPMEKPIICVGNLVAGGAGKTPVVLALADLLKDEGQNLHLLTRGYGGIETGPAQVSLHDTARDVGDEALLLMEKAPTWVSANRALGAQTAIDTGASMVVMDDGFQNAVIYKDFSLVVVDGAVGFGNGQIMPAGPLREPLAFGLSRAHAVVMVGADKTGCIETIRRHVADMPILKVVLEPDLENPEIKGKKIYAFAGIGRPHKFKETLEAAGAIIEGWAEFPDHYPYDDEDLKEIIAAAETDNALLVTTAKDHVRLPAAVQGKIRKFTVHIVWENASDVLGLIDTALQKRNT